MHLGRDVLAGMHRGGCPGVWVGAGGGGVWVGWRENRRFVTRVPMSPVKPHVTQCTPGHNRRCTTMYAPG